MALADLLRVKNRFIQILGANRLAYSNLVGTANAGISVWKYDQELTDILIDADAIVCTEGYFQSEFSLRNRFFVQSANIVNGAKLPEFVGTIGKAEYSTDGGITWQQSQLADSKEDVVSGARLGASYISANAFAGHHFFENGYAYHTSQSFRVEYPKYEKTTALQILDVHEPALLSTALGLAYKDSSIHAADYYNAKAEYLLDRIRQGSLQMKSYAPRALPRSMRG